MYRVKLGGAESLDKICASDRMNSSPRLFAGFPVENPNMYLYNLVRYHGISEE